MTSDPHTLPRSTWMLLIALTLGWGFNWPMMKLALAELPVWTFRGVCVVAGAAGVFLIALAGRRAVWPRPNQWPSLLLTSLFNVSLWNLCIAYGLTLVPVGRAVVLAYTMPLWVALLSRLLLNEALTRRRIVGVLLGMSGIVLLLANDLATIRAAPVGALLVVAAAMAWAMGTVLMKRYPTELPIISFTAWQLLLGGLPIAVGAAILEPHGWHPVSGLAVLAVSYNVLIAFVFCYWAWYKIVSRVPAGMSALSTLMIPVVGVFSSLVVLGEQPSWQEYVALVLVVAAIATVVVPSGLVQRWRLGFRGS